MSGVMGERWLEVIEAVRKAGHLATSVLMREAEPCELGRMPAGQPFLKLQFRQFCLVEKWNRGGHRERLGIVLQETFGEKFAVVAEFVEGATPLTSRSALLMSQRQPARTIRRIAKPKEQPVVSKTSPEGAHLRLQATWLSARVASEVVACLLGGAADADMQEATELYEMSVQVEVLAFRLMARGGQLAERIAAAQVDRDQRRAFSKEEKELLYRAAAGLCELCGVALGDSWHADHRYPFSKGGPTAVSNGAALCAGCNLSKGAKVLTVDEG